MNIEELLTLLLKDEPSEYIKRQEKQVFNIIPELKACKDFNRNSKWNGPNIYEHTLNVVDNVPKRIELRLSALFHDISKPSSCFEDDKKRFCFDNNWLVSADIFRGFAHKYKIDNQIKETVIKLITFQNININKLNEKELKFLTNVFNKEEIIMLYELKKAELKAQSNDYINIIKEAELKARTINYTNIITEKYKKQEAKVLKRYERR